jgi:hypothetical protein
MNAAAAAAAAPYKTVAEPFEAFEPGDTGYTAPTTAEVVTSSSGSTMVKFTAHFKGELGDRILACGGCRALGNWEPDAAPSLAWGEGDVWTATLELPPGTHEFKVRTGLLLIEGKRRAQAPGVGMRSRYDTLSTMQQIQQ